MSYANFKKDRVLNSAKLIFSRYENFIEELRKKESEREEIEIELLMKPKWWRAGMSRDAAISERNKCDRCFFVSPHKFWPLKERDRAKSLMVLAEKSDGDIISLSAKDSQFLFEHA